MYRGTRCIVLVAALALTGCAVPVLAHAQAGRPYYNDWRQTVYDSGYREGLRHGDYDARRGLSYDYGRDRVYRDGDYGWNRSYHDHDAYRRVFREGYQTGYAQGFQRVGALAPGRPYPPPPDGRNGNYGRYEERGRYGNHEPAYDNGYSDGYEKGSDDARHHRRPDLLRHKWYKHGDHGYGSWYGPRIEYENRYREGFRAGYDAGYRNFAPYGYRY